MKLVNVEAEAKDIKILGCLLVPKTTAKNNFKKTKNMNVQISSQKDKV